MPLSRASFDAVAALFHRTSGIRLTEAKVALVESRLQKLAREQGLDDVEHYVDGLIARADPAELTRLVDKLTTNETYFFREPGHFQHLEQVAPTYAATGPLRVWSAASSSGEEAYSIAMLLDDVLGHAPWEVLGTDLSTAMVAQARRGLYPLTRARHLPPGYLKRYCLRGHGNHDGHLLVQRELRQRVHFQGANLTQPLPELGSFQVIFLRNVLIYFDNPGKADIVRRVLTRLAPGGVLYTGHAESLSNLDVPVRALRPAVYAAA